MTLLLKKEKNVKMVHLWYVANTSLVILSVGTPSSGVSYAMLTRPNKVETAVHGF